MKQYLLYPAIALELLWHTSLPLLWLLDIFFSVQWWHYLLLSFPCLTLTPFALLFMRRTDEIAINDAPYQGLPLQRYELPWIFSWMETPDMLLPGGNYEPTIHSHYHWLRSKFGERVAAYFTSWEWLVRNAGQGIPWPFGREVGGLDDAELTTVMITILGKTVYIVWGSEVNRDWRSTKTNKGWWLVPGYFSIRLSPKGGA